LKRIFKKTKAKNMLLLVEDNPGDVDLIREYLLDAHNEGSLPRSFELVISSSLTDAIKRLEAGGIALVLLDLSLPESQGESTFHTLQAAAPDMPVVVLTGLDDREMAIKTMQAGAQDYLIKEQVNGSVLGRAIRYAIERYQLRQRAQEAAVVEERQRLARELHDSVTQSIYSLMLFSRTAREAQRAGAVEELETALERLGTLSLQALREMRLLLFELRPSILAEIGLINALRLRLDAVERRAGTEAQLKVSGNLNMDTETEAAIYSITMEALNNVLKHAEADQVTVEVAQQGPVATLTIYDNGRGFDPGTVEPGGLGLGSMHERAAQVSGQLEIISSVGQGTTVSFRLGS
jgi:signal transduction histidine kinase